MGAISISKNKDHYTYLMLDKEEAVVDCWLGYWLRMRANSPKKYGREFTAIKHHGFSDEEKYIMRWLNWHLNDGPAKSAARQRRLYRERCGIPEYLFGRLQGSRVGRTAEERYLNLHLLRHLKESRKTDWHKRQKILKENPEFKRNFKMLMDHEIWLLRRFLSFNLWFNRNGLEEKYREKLVDPKVSYLKHLQDRLSRRDARREGRRKWRGQTHIKVRLKEKRRLRRKIRMATDPKFKKKIIGKLRQLKARIRADKAWTRDLRRRRKLRFRLKYPEKYRFIKRRQRFKKNYGPLLWQTAMLNADLKYKLSKWNTKEAKWKRS